MGERVVVDPSAAGDPPPKRVVPLAYGQGDSWFTRAGRNWAPLGEVAGQVVRRRLGGWRRVGFALGVSFLAGGMGYALAEWSRAHEAGFLTAAGGLLIGLTMPIRAFDEPRN